MPRFSVATLKLVTGAMKDIEPVGAAHKPIMICGRSRPAEIVRAQLIKTPGTDERGAQLVAMRGLQPGDEELFREAAVVVYGGEVGATLDDETRRDLEVVGRIAAPKIVVLEALELPNDAVGEAALVRGLTPNDIFPYKRGWFPVRRVLGQLANRSGDAGPALAHRLPAFRPFVLEDIIESAARRNAAIALATFIPGANFPAMAAVELRMVLRIAACFGIAVSRERGLELLTALGAGAGMRRLARELLDFVPGIGWVVQSVVGYTGTRALGNAAVEYYERGAPADLARLRDRVEVARGHAVS
jgi:uncharacterized protein (DUF697 family)